MADLDTFLDGDHDDDEISLPDLGMNVNLQRLLAVSSTEPIKWFTKNDDTTKVTLDEARSSAWKSAKQEINFIRGKVQKAAGKKKVDIADLIDLVFGEDSELWAAFSRDIHISHETFLRFLGVFLLGSCHSKSCTQMYGTKSFIRSHANSLLPMESYKKIWGLIAEASLPAAIGQTTFWLSMQSAFNATCRKIFIIGINEIDLTLMIVLDDDKIHYETLKRDTDGLKVSRHIKDNRLGHVLHTAVLTYSGVVIGVEAERSEDDTIGSATKRLIVNQLRPSHGTNGPPNLRKVDFHSDRAYWSPDFHQWIIQSGADIGASTRKRSPDFPFTYDQKMRQNDTREDVPTSGGRRLFVKTSIQHGREISAIAYRNNGNVTLGMTSKFRGSNWDLVLENPDDKVNVMEHAWKYSVILSTAMVDLKEADVEQDDLLELISDLKIDHVTTNQNSPGWFLMRSFSITSSAADILLQELLKDFKLRKLQNSIATTAKIVFDFIFKNVPELATDDSENESDSESSESIDTSNDSTESDDEREFNINDIDANMSSWNKGGSILHMMAALDDGVVNQQLSNNLLGDYVIRMGGICKTKAANLSNIKAWLQSSVKRRPLLFLMKDDLVALALQKFGGAPSSYNKFTKEVLMDKLVGDSNGPDIQSQEGCRELWKRLIGCVLKSTFMLKLSGKGKEYAKVGHRNEEPLLEALLKSSENPHKVLQIMRPGLVSKHGYSYVKTSVDAIGFIKTEDGDLEIVGIEIKSRVTNASFQGEVNDRVEMSDDRVYEEIDLELQPRYVI
jgi:hypothetical protein